MLSKQTLESSRIRLVPLASEHLPELLRCGKDSELWKWVFTNYSRDQRTIEQWFYGSAQFDESEQLVVAIIDKASGKVAGNTRLFRVDKLNLSAEIGHTFVATQFQRTHINTHAKYLLLKYAFEAIGLVRVQFQTHEQNQKSRDAITRLGAQFEGISLKDRRLPNGNYRNTARFSITDEMWSDVKMNLEAKL
ncbi:GNAT family N-acetyltransferase [Pseudoalteromonas peptidolytica]|uniref:GNAT family N-acetyltransferase n=1 Tax=Pseudoalteromonas peptidolytica TaxID=61150 RepID=UPI00298E2147|nr:GNAT family protein [Pseudoalteromonas peptidolytica]MDW7549038.1 GNAT family protein [Pseudoalteromonas peptidolytica]